jgi:hypothetical protein
MTFHTRTQNFGLKVQEQRRLTRTEEIIDVIGSQISMKRETRFQARVASRHPLYCVLHCHHGPVQYLSVPYGSSWI